MTRISTINGLGSELQDRGKMVSVAPGYIPFMNLTKGEMRLALLAQQARIYSEAYPEFPEYKQAASMIENALRAGISNGVKFVGALHNDLLQNVAKEISDASKRRGSASKAGMLRSPGTGISGIGDVEFPFDFDHDCVQYATKKANARFQYDKPWTWWENNIFPSQVERNFYRAAKEECRVLIEIEQIVNNQILNASHHVLYYSLDEAFPQIQGSTVVTKHLFHVGGTVGLANATGLDATLVRTWTETSILQKNSQGLVGPVGSTTSSFFLSPDPVQYQQAYADWQQTRTGATIQRRPAKVGEPISVTVAAIAKLVGIIAAAITAAATLQRELNARKAGAMAAAQNYGTPALEARNTDFVTAAGPGGSNSNLLLIGAAVLGGMYLLNDE